LIETAGLSKAPTTKGMVTPNASANRMEKLQDKIGYRFKQPKLLQQALTHKSYSKTNNERLEFMGDAVLGYLVGSMLYRQYPDVQEDALSLMRAQLVRGKTLAQVALSIQLPECLLLGSGELRSGGRERASILADALEAVIGAVHEDGGIEQAQRLVHQLFNDLTKGLDAQSLKDPKTRLQELLQGNGLELPLYTVDKISGADHLRQYTVKCEVPALGLMAVAQESSRRGAEKASAQQVLILALAKQQTQQQADMQQGKAAQFRGQSSKIVNVGTKQTQDNGNPGENND